MESDDSGVKFYLHANTGEKYGKKLINIKSEPYNIISHNPVKILCHGWLDNKKSYWYLPTVQEYLKMGNVNVITVDWGKYSRLMYHKSVKSANGVGCSIALLIVNISEQYEIPFEKFHIIGHSLGSHIAGFAGKFIREKYKAKIGRITGLDPAGPSFKDKGPELMLCSDDALFVDIIHTDGGYAGLIKQLGHIDFYPNGGTRKQNGCKTLELGGSHKRAPLYYAESINSYAFVAVACESINSLDKFDEKNQVIMGEYVDTATRGIYYLKTNKNVPFGLGNVYGKNMNCYV